MTDQAVGKALLMRWAVLTLRDSRAINELVIPPTMWEN